MLKKHEANLNVFKILRVEKEETSQVHLSTLEKVKKTSMHVDPAPSLNQHKNDPFVSMPKRQNERSLFDNDEFF